MADITLDPDAIINAESTETSEATELTEASIELITDDKIGTGFLISEAPGFFVISIENPSVDIIDTIVIKVTIGSMEIKGGVSTSIAFDPEGPFVEVDLFEGLASNVIQTISVTLTSAQLNNINNLLIRIASNVPGTLISKVEVIATEVTGGQIIVNAGQLIITQGEITI